MKSRGFTVLELIIVIAILAVFIFAIKDKINLTKQKRTERHLKVYALGSNELIYAGKARCIERYTFGTGVKFYDANGQWTELAGNAIVELKEVSKK